jgi:hypothetical protein
MISNSYQISLILMACGISNSSISQKNIHSNVLIIITDEKGYGDSGVTGNSQIKTHVIDGFARKSLIFNDFCVSPVCAPKPIMAKEQMYLETNTIINQMKNDLNTNIIETNNVSLPELNCAIIPYYLFEGKGILPFWVEIEKIF